MQIMCSGDIFLRSHKFPSTNLFDPFKKLKSDNFRSFSKSSDFWYDWCFLKALIFLMIVEFVITHLSKMELVFPMLLVLQPFLLLFKILSFLKYQMFFSRRFFACTNRFSYNFASIFVYIFFVSKTSTQLSL